MALSPEDVIKKSFSATHLRRGYDETQVDDFLDEIVVEFRRLHSENEVLHTDLEDCRAGRGISGDATESYGTVTKSAAETHPSEERSQDAGSAEELAELRRQLAHCEEARAEAEGRAKDPEERATAHAAADEDGETSSSETEDLRAQVSAAEAKAVELQEQLDAAQERADAAERSTAELDSMNAAAADGEDPSSIISLAQRLHDQHVAEGESTKGRLIDEGDSYKTQVVTEADEQASELQRTGQETYDRLVGEGQQTHDRLVGEGQATHDELVATGEQSRDELVTTGQSNHDQMIGEAEQKRTSVLADLDQKQAALSGKIQGLHRQESELRERLRAFLNDQMDKVNGSQD